MRRCATPSIRDQAGGCDERRFPAERVEAVSLFTLEKKLSITAYDQIRQLESRMGRRAGVTPPVPAGLSMALGSAYFRLNQLEDAEREYKATIGVDPSFGEAHSNLAVVYLVTGRITESDAAVRAAEQAGFKVNPRLKDDITAAKKKSRLD